MYNEKTYNLEITDSEQPYISAADTAVAGHNVILSAHKTNLPGWEIARYYWNFGDETVATGMEVNKKFLKPGTYNVQLIVTAEPEKEELSESMYLQEYCYNTRTIMVTVINQGFQ
jgi:hypothetical protein